ncbi:hypothetical protein [Desulfogranum marinum]|uniref:hypothetical protein n=1 Tax=Desulfogranum marinum TaxID=453220 RepID=UPI0029C92740|nr:hypothetical protein [Desulfogranum marinum]
MLVFIIECTNPIDLLQGRNEGKSLEQICRLVGHEVINFHPKSKDDLLTVCKYRSSIDRKHDGTDNPDLPLCIHISSHGEDGLWFGKDLVSWHELLDALEPICTKKSMYKGDNILTISACEAKDQRLTEKIQKRRKVHKAFQPPRHFFVTASEEVYWKDAVVAWALFYNKIPNTNLSKKKKIFNVLDLIEKAELGTIHYYRWSTKKKKYICYGAQGKIKNS